MGEACDDYRREVSRVEIKVKVTADIMDMIENFRKERLYDLNIKIEETNDEQLKKAYRMIYRQIDEADQGEIIRLFLKFQATEVRFK